MRLDSLAFQRRDVHRIITRRPEVGVIAIIAARLGQATAAIESENLDPDFHFRFDLAGTAFQCHQASADATPNSMTEISWIPSIAACLAALNTPSK